MYDDNVPSLLAAADQHSIASSGASIIGNLYDAATGAKNFVTVSAWSAANSFVNSAIALHNLAAPEGREYEEIDNYAQISSYDEDLGKYYRENKSAADLVGFIGASFIPGTLGIKGLNAAQGALRAASAGYTGGTMRLATNLLAPSMQTYVRREAADLAARSAVFKFSNTNSLRAIAAGTQQTVLETLAFEGMVAATMFKSPVFEDMDGWDMVGNAMLGVGFGAAIGGVASTASTYFGVKRLLKNADSRGQELATGSRLFTKTGDRTSVADELTTLAHDQVKLSVPVTPEQVIARKRLAGETTESLSDEAVQAEVAYLNRQRQNNLEKMNNDVRKGLRKLANDDVHGNMLADLYEKLPLQGRISLVHNLTEVQSVSKLTASQKILKNAEVDDLDTILPRADEVATFVRMHSGKIGDVSDKYADAVRLAEKLSPDQLAKRLNQADTKLKHAPDFRKLKNADFAEARWIASRSKDFAWTPKAIVGSHDLPYLQRAVDDGLDKLRIRDDAGVITELNGRQAIADYLLQAKEEVLAALAPGKHSYKANFLELATDVRADFLATGKSLREAGDAFRAMNSYAAEASKFYGKEFTAEQLSKMPRVLKTSYATDNTVDGMVLEGMQLIKYRQKLAKETADRTFAAFAGKISEAFPDIPEELLRRANRSGSGAGTFTNAGAGYGTLEEMTSYIGGLTAELTKSRITAMQDAMTPVTRALMDNPQAAVAFSGINEAASGARVKYVLSESGEELIPSQVADYYKALAKGEEVMPPQLPEGTLDTIPLLVKGDEAATKALRDAVVEHISRNGARNEEFKMMAAAQGLEATKRTDVFQPFRPNPRDYKHVAFVKDETLTGVGHTKMLFANTAEELEAQIAKVNSLPHPYRVVTKGQAEDFYDAMGEWKYDKTLHDNYLDHDLASRGIQSRFFPMSDPQKIVATWVADHTAKEHTLIKEAVGLKYQKEIAELKRLGELFTNTQSSYVGTRTLTEQLSEAAANPYLAQVKSMLNIVKLEEVPAWVTTNQWLDRTVSKAYNKVTEVFGKAKGDITPQQVDEINSTFETLGLRSSYHDAATHILANSSVPRGVAGKFVRESNAFLTSTILRLDAMNSLNNLIGNTVLFSAELKSITKAIAKGNAEGAGDLAKLMSINLPGQEGALVRSPSKLIANSFQRILGQNKDALIAEYKARGLAPDLTDQFFKALDAMTLTGSETAAAMAGKSKSLKEAWNKFVEVGSKVTGNTWSEQFNRLIAADVMKQITEVAVKHGVLDEKAAWAYVNTFSNRVNGVVRAAERPLMFQGPIGQAIGLFQSYQFNLMQQMFRYMGDGNRKLAAMAMGLQGTMYGASSLPGFNAVNNYLIAGAFGNEERKDMYALANSALGKTGAEWLMYGAPSNILKASIFTRGDTNPRTWSVVPNPTNPMEVPFVSAYAKAIDSVLGVFKNSAQGAPVVDSLIHGIEHSGLSRPLAGLAATSRALVNEDGLAATTNRAGAVMWTNDLASWTTLVRIAGAKPIDEAIMTDHFFRLNSYRQKDAETKKTIATQVRLGYQGGGKLDPETVRDFAERYVAAGGKQTGFNQFMVNQYMHASPEASDQLTKSLGTKYGQQFQELLGGRQSLYDLD